jgi:hypothetical protein
MKFRKRKNLELKKEKIGNWPLRKLPVEFLEDV